MEIYADAKFPGPLLHAGLHTPGGHTMRRMKFTLLATAAALLVPAQACINISDVNLDGKKMEFGEDMAWASKASLLPDRANAVSFQKWEKELATKMAGTPTVRERSDYGGVLVFLGHFQKAREVLEAAEQAEPGDYAVASNLGTAYELLGENAKALEWIRKGIERKADSHHGTEWVHVKILEAKLALAGDPKWLETHTVLGLDYGRDARPVRIGEAPAAKEKYTVLHGLSYQLRERLKFVKAPDPLVGDLLFNLANETAVLGAAKQALGIYELAAEYKSPDAALLKQRTEYVRSLVTKGKKRR